MKKVELKKQLHPLSIVGLLAALFLLVFFFYVRYSTPAISPIIHGMPKPGDPVWFNPDGTPRDGPPPGAGQKAVTTTPGSRDASATPNK